MITGFILSDGSELAEAAEKYRLLKDETDFPGSKKTEYSHERIQITCFSHSDLPETFQYYHQNDLIVLFLGHLYGNNRPDAGKIAVHYRENGLDLLDELNGDFSLLIFDLQKRSYFFIKDHLGIIPLTLARWQNVLFFASDTMALCKSLYKDASIDRSYTFSRFYDFAENYSFLPNKGAQKVLPGHYAIYDGEHIRMEKYWFPENTPNRSDIDFTRAVTELGSLIENSVQIRIDQQGKIGSHISGGLDSSLMSVLTRKSAGSHHAFSWSPDNYEPKMKVPYDERKLIREQCDVTGLTPVFTDISEEEYLNFARNWRCPSESIFEEPLQHNAKERNINTLVSGWGGDEFIGVRDEALLFELFRKGKLGLFKRMNRKPGMKNLVMHFVNNVLFPLRRKVYLTTKIHPDKFHYFKPDHLINNTNEEGREWFRSKRNYQLSMIGYKHLSQRCEDWYVLGYRNGITYRYPLLDKRIVEYSISLPSELFASADYDRPLMRGICKGKVIEDIRLLMKQGDPVLMKNALEIQKKVCLLFEERLNEYRSNPDLDFIDFDLLERDIAQNKADSKDLPKQMQHLLFLLESTHSFTESYHQKNF